MPYRYGQKHHRAKLSDDQVRQIRADHFAYVPGNGYKALGVRYGVSASTIRDIITYRTRRSA